MKYFFVIALMSCFFNPGYTQFSGHAANPHNITGPLAVLKTEIPLAEPSMVGSSYLYDEWKQGEIVLKNGVVIPGLALKVEVEQGNVEIDYNGAVKFLDLRHLDFVKFTEGTSQNKTVIKRANEFSFKDVPLKGIVLVYHEGNEYSIVKNCYIEVLQANYNVAMDVGSRDHRKVMKEKLFIVQKGKWIAVKGSSKKIAEQLGADKQRALEIIKANKLDLSDETQLKTFVYLMQN